MEATRARAGLVTTMMSLLSHRVSLVALVLALTGCSANDAPSKNAANRNTNAALAPPPENTEPTSMAKKSSLDSYVSLASLDKDQLIGRLDAGPQHLREGAAYEKATGLTELYKPDASPARFYFRDEKLVVIYLSDRGVLDQLDEATLESELGAPAGSLRSRAGKHSELRVYPEKGIAFSSGDELDFIEIFPPTTLDGYKSAIYSEPGPFIK